MAKGLIATVGGTPQPLIATIVEHKPELVCFLCSQESVEKIKEIKDGIANQLGEQCIQRDHKVLVEDYNDVVHCYEKAQECFRKLKDWGITPEEIVVDYTGGTKSMSVALGLAAVRFGCMFSYVGGSKRTKEGLGIVVDGTEQVYTSINPWSFFAVEEKRRIAEAFNSYQFIAALEATRNLLARPNLDPTLKQFLQIFELLCEGYSAWDRFEHQKATESLKKAASQLESYVELGSRESYRSFLKDVKSNLEWLQRLQRQTHGFKHPARSQVFDLIANAKRRIDEGKYDDAVARLYRALEMEGQVCLREDPLRIESASDVPEEKLPEGLRDEFKRKYREEQTGKIKLPLYAVFRLLERAGHPRGKRFQEMEKELKKILSARNHSILAHGTTPIQKDTCEEFLRLILEFLGDSAEENVVFAKMPIE